MLRHVSISAIFFFFVFQSTLASASDFNIELSEDKRTFTITADKSEIEIGVTKDCDIKDDGGNYGFTNCQALIGDLTMPEVSAQIGQDGVGFSLDNGIEFGDLEFGAGELQFALMTGDQIDDVTELPDVIGTVKDDHFYLYSDVDTAIELNVGENTIAMPSPVDVSASVLLDLTGKLMYYQGPIPNPTVILDGVNKFVSSASGSSSRSGVISGALGYSVYPSFSYESAHDVYQSYKSDPDDEEFEANVVMMGEFDLGGLITVEGDLFLDVTKGKLGINGSATLGPELFGAGITIEVADGAFLVDKDGIRFGLGSDPSSSLPDGLQYITQFATPMLNSTSNTYGLATSINDFLFRMEVENASATGIDAIDGGFELSPSGLAIDAKFQLDGVGKVKVEGEITNSKCELTAEKIKIFDLYELKDATVKFCDAARDGLFSFDGDVKILGVTVPVSGVGDVAKSAASELAKDAKFNKDFNVQKKFGVSGSGIAGGYVKLTASGDIDAALKASSGAVSTSVDLDGKAKFCGEVKVGGFKKKKCSSTGSGISVDVDVNTGCLLFDASKKVLGKTFKIDNGKACPFPAANEDSVDYGNDDLESDNDELASDDLGVVVALKDYNGNYVTWDDDLMLRTTRKLSDKTLFTLVNKDDDDCPMEGSKIAIHVGDGVNYEEYYWRVKKDKNTSLNAQADDADKNTTAKKRFYINKVKIAGNCLSDGDQIKLKNKEYGRWVATEDSTLIAKSDANGDNRVYTVIFDTEDDE